jgi:hypothetical protein
VEVEVMALVLFPVYTDTGKKQEHKVSKSRWYALIKALRVLPQIWRFMKSKPSSEQFQREKEALVANFRKDGATEQAARDFEVFIETIAIASQEIQEDKETYYKIDTYLIGGLGIVSLVLLQVLASTGHPDVASSIAWLSLAIALPCTAGFLLLGFLKKEYGAHGYGSIPEKVAFIAELAGFISITALIWHVWFWAGIVFLPFAFALFTLCTLYKLIVVFMKHWGALPTQEPDKVSEKQPEEN